MFSLRLPQLPVGTAVRGWLPNLELTGHPAEGDEATRISADTRGRMLPTTCTLYTGLSRGVRAWV